MSEQLRNSDGRFGPSTSPEAPVVLTSAPGQGLDHRVVLGPSQARLSDAELDALSDDELDLPPGPDDAVAIENVLYQSGREMDDSTPDQLARAVRVAIVRSAGNEGVARIKAEQSIAWHTDMGHQTVMDVTAREWLDDSARSAVEEIAKSSRQASSHS